MKTIMFYLLIFFLLSSPPLLSQLINQKVEDKIKIFETWLNSKIETEEWPGVIIGIVYDQELIWKKAYGYANVIQKSLLTDTTIFPVASNTKMFTSIAVLKLRDEGKLRLDDPIEDYLPWLRNIKKNYTETRSVTIRDLLTHSSGIQRDANFPYWFDFNFPSLQQVIDKIDQHEIVYPPGLKWKYSNLGTSLLGAMITEVSNISYKDYMIQNILEPLNMTSTGFNKKVYIESEKATGYSRVMNTGERIETTFYDRSGTAPAGGLYSNVNDLAKFLSWQFRLRNGGGFEIINANTLIEMQTVHKLIDDSWSWGYGYGFIVYKQNPCNLIGHGGHTVGFRADLTMCPEHNIGIITLANADDIPVYPDISSSISRKMFEWVVPDLRETITSKNNNIKSPPEMSRFVGKYLGFFSDYKILIIDNHLNVVDINSSNPYNTLIKLNYIKDNSFRAITKDGYTVSGEIINFDENEKGEITKMYLGAETLSKVE